MTASPLGVSSTILNFILLDFNLSGNGTLYTEAGSVDWDNVY
jgi:hypothetical protein